jgi:hypothetical protein
MKDGELVQTITHPAISVWAVAAMPNGDIVTGCSDGIIRVFSRSESRWADEATLKVSMTSCCFSLSHGTLFRNSRPK